MSVTAVHTIVTRGVDFMPRTMSDSTTPAVTHSATSRYAELFVSVRASVRRAAAIVRRIIGVPDYDTYIAHMSAHHPDAVPMTAKEFEITRMNDRYSRPGSRCC